MNKLLRIGLLLREALDDGDCRLCGGYQEKHEDDCLWSEFSRVVAEEPPGVQCPSCKGHGHDGGIGECKQCEGFGQL